MKNNTDILIKVIKLNSNNLPLPSYSTENSSGMDLYSAMTQDVILAPGCRACINTGIAISVPNGYEAQVRPRSGLALKFGITVLNTPGTIDADYRGEIKVILINLGHETYTIKYGDRIAQMVIAPVIHASWNLVKDLDDDTTKRGDQGFGSTGI
ncbi:dUTP diphosphatase [Ehrlichia canis]|uniref:Deoxyuridine 5'-triphosphate nucleotidohydrolase n=1 Tax=Ehrlichia canis (strain Jake) TaxID=269484 RepID=DUT_EHRCJ|nr:dUTP diphosphatase [Ehrlichia canis]Q3YRU2.1 RecName: Full=Deoxyuridine 5'-triphosphate nucleotidohydrolase; Short=dUTPase; AltName: Full=dUTP pyrophosphatase [Ehrlichia canis str. Jake]AAZ68563.1 deoxyuridine 5'-triphosphate nucleotidohydrolase [Ehrlichia canis str. Jake]AUO54696.1 dUTP diphosphatase [Ehrlichia canis]UKC53698.1 dUTP diphosphatase [Ehrlichia canis]UKC54636.1 dUTP diphosphatase [Ehrlichia canis]UKC55572.1 dUTP diphosphatase [Ehrlichia canis]